MSLPELPVALVARVARSKVSAVGVSTSPFTLSAQLQEWGGEVWKYDITLAIHTGRNGKKVSAFFAALGSAGLFLFRDPTIDNGSGYGTPLVNGAGQTGGSLITDGWGASGLQMGDFFSLGTDVSTRLHQLTADATPVGGAATLQFTPRLRSSPADNAPLQLANPKVVLRLVGAVPAEIQRADKYNFTFSAVEAI